MVNVTIYTRNWCGYCFRAKRLLEAKGVAFEEIDVDVDLAREREMIQRSGGRLTVPQVFIDGEHIGGSDELHDLERRGELDRLLGFQS
jgi:glutaredoxin 3